MQVSAVLMPIKQPCPATYLRDIHSQNVTENRLVSKCNFHHCCFCTTKKYPMPGGKTASAHCSKTESAPCRQTWRDIYLYFLKTFFNYRYSFLLQCIKFVRACTILVIHFGAVLLFPYIILHPVLTLLSTPWFYISLGWAFKSLPKPVLSVAGRIINDSKTKTGNKKRIKHDLVLKI